MKSTLTFLFLLSCLITNAQRYMDISLELKEPINNYVLEEGNPFSLSFVVKNAGPDTIQYTDSVNIYLYVDNIQYVFLSGMSADSFKAYTQVLLAPGDSMVENLPPINTNLMGSHTICLKALPFSSNNIIADTAINNNQSCAKVIIVPVGISERETESTGIKLLNNPVDDYARFEINMSREDMLQVRVCDMNGHLVLLQNNLHAAKGRQVVALSLADLPAGMYVYSITTSTAMINGKLMKQ